MVFCGFDMFFPQLKNGSLCNKLFPLLHYFIKSKLLFWIWSMLLKLYIEYSEEKELFRFFYFSLEFKKSFIFDVLFLKLSHIYSRTHGTYSLNKSQVLLLYQEVLHYFFGRLVSGRKRLLIFTLTAKFVRIICEGWRRFLSERINADKPQVGLILGKTRPWMTVLDCRDVFEVIKVILFADEFFHKFV